MSNEKASPSRKEEKDPAPQRPLQAAVEDIKNDLTRLLGLLQGEECSRDPEVTRNIMSIEKASPLQNEKNENVPQRPLMRAELVRAAIEGNKNDLIRLLGLQGEEHSSHDHEVTVALLGNEFGSDVADIRSSTHMGNTILHILATCGHSDLVSMCYQKEPALLRLKNNKLETPLHCAAKAGHNEVILKLIELARSEGEVSEGEVSRLKEFLREKNCNGETALHEAARHGHAYVVSVLMLEDPDLAGVISNDKISPLYLATSRGSIDIVKIMVERLSDRVIEPAFYSGPNGQTALHAAVLRDSGQELQQQLSGYLLKISDVQLKKECSALSDSFSELILQLRSVASPAQKFDDTGSTPLHIVASIGCYYLAELLIKHDSSLGYLRNSVGLLPVHLAACMGHAKTIIIFLQLCSDSHELLDDRGRNFFHAAAEQNRLEVFREILEKPKVNLHIPGINEIFRNMINTRDNEGNTPLHLAVLRGNYSIARTLLTYKGVDLRLQNKKGLTALDISLIECRKKSENQEDMQFWIEGCMATRNSEVSPAWVEHYIDEQKVTAESANIEKVSNIELIDKIQIIGLGSVLISTVAFAAAFTLPGGYNSENGTPVFGSSYAFNTFILADVLAFAFSFLSTMHLIFRFTNTLDPKSMEKEIAFNVEMFRVAAKSLTVAMALGLYVVLAPVSKSIGIVVCVVAAYLVLLDPIFLVRAVINMLEMQYCSFLDRNFMKLAIVRTRTNVDGDKFVVRTYGWLYYMSRAYFVNNLRIVFPLIFIFLLPMYIC